MLKYISLLSIVLLIITTATAQSVGINKNIPDASAALDVTDTARGVLIPRLTQAQRTSIAGSAKGLLVFDSTSNSFWYRTDTAWLELSAASKTWNLTGNSGADTSVNFIGTADDMPLVFKVNNSPAGMIDPDNGNTGLGFFALYNNFRNGNVGSSNTATGAYVLYSNTNGYSNTANGDSALFSNTTGGNNTANGHDALFSNTTGTYNTAIGDAALYSNTTGSYNTAEGYSSLTKATSTYNTAYGAYSLYSNTTGDHNTAVGDSALYSITSSINNTAVGARALQFITAGGNTAMGYLADVAAGWSNATVIGSGAFVAGDNYIVVGNSSVASIGGSTGWTTFVSDGRFKNNIKEDVPGLAFITRLRPVTYTVNTQKLDEHTLQNLPANIKAKRMQTPEDYARSSAKIQTGFVAQEVEKVAKDLGYDFDGVNLPQNPADHYSIAYSQFVMPLVKAIQEQQQQLSLLKKNNASLSEKNNQATAVNEILLLQLDNLLAEASSLDKKLDVLAAQSNNTASVAANKK